MTAYAIGDLQGCYQSFQKLLATIKLDWQKDKLWLCGDLVNRGPQSLETLRFIYEHRERIKVVLGNHDLHMLAVASGAQSIKRKDTFLPIIESAAHQDLIEWLHQQPLARYGKNRRVLMVHAGVAQQWTLADALACSDEVSEVLQNNNKRSEFFNAMYGNEPELWSDALEGTDRLRFITNAFTRMRFCHRDGRLDMSNKCKPGKQPDDLKPWFKLPLNLEKKVQVVFGHWAALEGKLATKRFQALDTGCVWGGQLTALNLKTGERTSVDAV
ncbi:symmetrical bis(5'-nucleosyl)-tetraphosphatase [Pleionea mediterranea]|uniref:Bis(5'-nucleosyl)-tetraphosphatase, symmetrical n=1 Tax=Pleionea mediterranea TaxID=523701 RepID=A0A316FWA3_9GAMM|nr:symmetrical bis(5'-nucleosyl)-tetraphosphatase [Pleionea mediterranea]PWK53084.1 bis(5'nucleosyl)-tetraphosphatase ApaH [Pleionea mediterranea]